MSCDIVGYVDTMIAVIEFDNKQKHCIHPSYLKEMQASSYGQRFASKADSEENEAGDSEAEAMEAAELDDVAAVAGPATEPPAETTATPEPARQEAPSSPEPKKTEAEQAKAAKPRSKKIELPEEKVKLVATVKSFTTVPNHFSDNDDEVIIYESVSIVEPETELGEAWSSHSATIKKLELSVGDTITFEAKLVAKKLTKHPVPYKINNPAKIQKQS